MFGIKAKIKENHVETKENEVKKILTFQELDRMYEAKECQFVDSSNTALNGDDLSKIRMMITCEKAGFSPFIPNQDWYSYRIAGNWKTSSILNAVSAINLDYRYPLPIKAIYAIQKVWNTLPNRSNDDPEIYLSVISANPNLGIAPQERNSVAVINVDPILMLTIDFNENRKYYYNLAQWDLKIDLDRIK